MRAVSVIKREVLIDPSTIASVERKKPSWWNKIGGSRYATICYGQEGWVVIDYAEYQRLLPELQKLPFWE